MNKKNVDCGVEVKKVTRSKKVKKEQTSSNLEKIVSALKFKLNETSPTEESFWSLKGRIRNLEEKLKSRKQFEFEAQ